jgi:gas vesicle protein
MTAYNKINAIFFFLAGMAAGAGLALLFAPRSGEETRDLIRQRAEEGKDFVASKKDELWRKADHAVEKGKKEVRRKAEDIIDKGRETVEDWKEKGKATVEDWKEKGKAFVA